MALEQEVAGRQNDVTSTQQLATQITAAAPGLAQALTLTGQFGSALTSAAQQLTALAAGVHDAISAAQAQTTAMQIQGQCQAALGIAAPAQQAWQGVTSLSQQRASWLLARWQQCHLEAPAGTPVAMAEPLAQALAAYNSAAAQLDATMRSATTFPAGGVVLSPPPGPGGPPPTGPGDPPPPPPAAAQPAALQILTPAQVIAWLQECSQFLTAAASQIAADTGELTTTLAWSTVQAAAATAVTTAQSWLALAQRIATALAGPVDPASLTARLSDLTALRVSICPDPITPADRATYNLRMAELDTALTGLLAAPTGAAASPIAMLPVRLETRLFPAAAGGTEIRIRVYVDNLHVNAHDPRLTPDEAEWVQHIQSVTAGGAVLPAPEWAQLAGQFGPARAAYLLNPGPAPGSRPGPLTAPAVTAALPDHWLAIAYGPDGTLLGAAAGVQISPAPLQVSPDPLVEPTGQPDDVRVDPAVRWMIDFDTAVAQGMGISLLVDGGASGAPPASATTGPATVSRLVVVGVQAADGTAVLTELLAAHHYTGGLELVPYGTPSNNTGSAPAGFSTTDPGYARSYALEVLRPSVVTGDAARLAGALGIDPGAFAAAAAAPLAEQTDQQAMTALTWPATWGTFLTGFTGMSPATAEALRSWAVAWLRPEGPLPTLAVGRRVTGIIPVVALAQWNDAGDSTAAGVHRVVTGALSSWLGADPAAADLDFDSLLSRRPVTAEVFGRAGAIMPGWLQTAYDLMGVTNSQIATSTGTTLPGMLAQIGAAIGQPGPLAWPAGFLVLPDPIAPAAPWPLVVPDGTLPLTTAASQAGAPAGYLPGLAAAGPVTNPVTLLEFVASQSCAATPGVSAASSTLTARGNLGDLQEPAAPPAAAELSGAISYLAGRPGADFDSLFGGALDAASFRLDAWATALATKRLGELRAASKTGILVGGFSWVENLVARAPLKPAQLPAEPAALADPYNAGYQLAPSLQQATTAAVLRSGYLTHNPVTPGAPPLAGSAAFSVDLSSRRARLAGWLLDGVRQGQPLSVLLGYRFERTLQESGLGDLIGPFRQVAPYSPVIIPEAGSTSGAPTEAAVPTDVVDGVALTLAAASAPGPPSAAQWAQAQPALTELSDALDAAADAVTAQAVHDTLTGNTYAAAATLDAVASGSVPPTDLTFLDTTRTGIAVHHRVLVPVAAGEASPPAGWPGTPRGYAEPALTSWVAGLLGDPAQISAAVSLVDSTGTAVPGGPVPITLASLGLGPLDIVALADSPAELERLAVHAVLGSQPAAARAAADGTLDTSPAGAARPLAAALTIAMAAGQVIGTGRAADARDLAPAGTVTDPGVSVSDLGARVNGSSAGPPGILAELASAAAAFAAALPGDPQPGSGQPTATGVPAGASPDALAAALQQAVLLGVIAAAPAGTGAAALPALVSQARGAWTEIVSRQTAVGALATAAASPDQPTALGALLGQLEAAFGGGFTALPRVTTAPANLLASAAALTVTETTDASQGPDAWLVKASRVHQSLADLLDACCGAEALGSGPSLALTIAQLPLPQPATTGDTVAPAPWAGQPFTSQPPAANCLSLAMIGAAPPPGPLAALVVADWTEVIPSASELTGLTYHYDAPDAQAPQAVLLAVPASPAATGWAYGDLVATVGAARDLAHARGADYADLPAAARQVLPAAYFANPTVLKPGPWPAVPPELGVPPGYMVQTLEAVTIVSVSVLGGALEQSKAGQITVIGTSFAPAGVALPPSAFAVTGGGVTILSGTVSNTQATLNVQVDPNAAAGTRGLAVGTASQPNCITINLQPRATGCDTTRLSQAMTAVTQTVTVTGQVLSAASISGTGGPTVTWTLASRSSTQVLITVTIAASTYSPYSPYVPPTGSAALRPELTNGGGSEDGGGPLHYRPPVHVTVPLTLTVTPATGEPEAIFAIVLDEIV